jgi:NADPH:quinone reductase-like Zn-dependent oxidoreductase
MSRAVIYEKFGGPEVLEPREAPEPHAGPGEIRVRVTAAGLNPMDGGISSIPEAAAMFGVTVPSGFGHDFAGVVDEAGAGVDGFTVGDRVYGGAMAKAAADLLVMKIPAPAPDALFHTPDGISDEVASTLPVAGRTAAAALEAIGLRSGDTVPVGGAAGSVGVFTVQLAKLAGATVIGTASESTFEFLRQLGTEPVAYGPGLADRVRAPTLPAACAPRPSRSSRSARPWHCRPDATSTARS